MKKKTSEKALLRQLVLNLEEDIKNINYSDTTRDADFLEEVIDKLDKGKFDPTQYEYGIGMLQDWLCELKSKIEKYEKENYM